MIKCNKLAMVFLRYNVLNGYGRFNINSRPFLKFSTVHCWKCSHQKSRSDLFCLKCGIIQKPTETDSYFRLFGMEEQFQIDKKYLKDRFRQLQSYLHPDKFGCKTEEEKVISEDYSSLLNKAYNTLLTPIQRAEYLLKLRSQELEESATVTDPKFLMEMMELNEKVEESGTNIEKLQILNKENKGQLEKLVEEINQNFKSDDIATAKENIVKMKYYNSVHDRINHTLRELSVAD